MLELVAPDLLERHVYMCGPDGFMTAARGLLQECGFDLANLHAESFASARSVSEESVPEDGQRGSLRPAAADAVSVDFARKGRRVVGSRKLSLLEIAEAHGIELDYGCRIGNCGDCRLKVLSGEVSASGDSGISAAERAEGWTLSCVATPRGDCVVDA
jgi:ferredoxin